MKVDFHIHSKYSDGDLTPQEIATHCYKSGIQTISITDHDTIIGYNSYKIIKDVLGINIIPGIEITTSYRKLHILGYNIQDIDMVEGVMYQLRKKNIGVCKEVIKLLNSACFELTLEEVMENTFDGILDKKSIVRTMIKKGYVERVVDAYDLYIGKKAKFYVPIRKLSIYEAINLINKSGGIPVIAHPFFSGLDYEDNIVKEITDLKEMGALGVEVYYRYHTIEQLKKIKQICIREQMLITGGSDFHSYKNNDEFGIELPDEDVKKLIKA